MMESHIGNVFRVTPENFQITQEKIISHIRKTRLKKEQNTLAGHGNVIHECIYTDM